MNKRLFTARLTPRCPEAAKGDIDGILHLRQCVGQLWIVRIKNARNVRQRSTCRGRNVVHPAILDQQPQQMIAHQPGCSRNQYLTHFIPFTE